jgi:hypothetical protein
LTAAAASRLQELQQRFLSGLDVRLGNITATLEGFADPGSLRLMFHSLAGIGGTYGFPRITELSRFAETLCAGVVDERREITSNEKNVLRRSVLDIQASAPQRILTAAASEV